MKRVLLGLCLLLFLGVPLALGAAISLCFQDEPLVRRAAEFTTDDVERAVRVFEKHDPRRMKSGALRTMTLHGDELDLAVNYLANRFGKGSSRLVLRPGVLALTASVEVPASPLGRYVNVQALLRETAGLPTVEDLRIGSLPVPNVVADWALARAMHTLNQTEEYRIAADTIRSVSIADGSVRVVYEWRDDLPGRVGNVLVPPADSARLRIYQERLAQLTRDSTLPLSVSVSELLSPLMRLAAERGTDPQAESRAAIVVLAFYVNGKGLAAIAPGAKDWPRPVLRTVTLNGRTDFPQHFTISAAIAAHAGTPLSDAIGLYKEVDDSRRGSGFSFNDIAADRAGTTFGELATRSAASARPLQRRVAAGGSESAVMPNAADLPEFMPEAEFKRRFGGIGAPAYQRMMQDIERRVAACPLYR
ncbi:MAG: hypothetical protein ABWY07_02075 [Burkholderiales bacterium]